MHLTSKFYSKLVTYFLYRHSYTLAASYAVNWYLKSRAERLGYKLENL